ncbi:helix-turn-helix domain-containing protein [Arachidicoccus sp.]|jgi:transcriptional regulator with XRE-family HTH domain|uniref:helix-turn-helix domain-containing protein n=1 Tax=Arachidicoccus sp. TaxID=1872624 RepID=UPI003D25C9F7
MSYTLREKAGAALQALRIEKNIKQEIVAAKLNVNRATVSKIENGLLPVTLVIVAAYREASNISIYDAAQLIMPFL